MAVVAFPGVSGPYRPRSQFVAYHERRERFAKIVAHRRFGKTVGSINDAIAHAVLHLRPFPPPRFGYVAPTFSEAKERAWLYLKHYSGPLTTEASENELWVEYPNKARIRLYGVDNIHRMRGIYLDGVILDEPAQMHPDAWPSVILPTLADYNGWATFIGTPHGRDWFANLSFDDKREPLPNWFRLTLKASETGVLSADKLAEQRLNMSPEQYAQEFECSFDAAIHGAYYGRALAEAERDGRICHLAADPLLPLRAYFDIGGAGNTSDAMAIWIVQFVGERILLLDYIEAIGQPIAYYTQIMRERGYDRAVCVFPHDGANPDAHAKRYVDHWREAGFECLPPVPNMGRGAAMMRIEAARRLFPKMWFHVEKTIAGRLALADYHEKWDAIRRIGLGPFHGWSSHCADAFGLMATQYRPPLEAGNFDREINYPNYGVA